MGYGRCEVGNRVSSGVGVKVGFGWVWVGVCYVRIRVDGCGSISVDMGRRRCGDGFMACGLWIMDNGLGTKAL